MTPVEALQAALQGEHAAVYVYGVLGGRVSRSSDRSAVAAVTSAYTTHRARRDQLVTLVRSLGAQPVVGEVAYQLSGPAQTTAQILHQARVVEARCAELYAQAVAATSGVTRQWGIDALVDAAVRVIGLGGAAEAYPGAPEL